MAGVNKVIILGRLGNDPEMRTFPNGDQIAIINVATSEKWQDKQSGELKENTEWHRIIFYRRLAEITGKYLKKGSKVYLEGKLKTRKWQDENGQERQTKEIQGESLQLLDTKPEQTSTPSSTNAYQQAKNGNYTQNATSDQAFKDDIPF